MSLTCDIEINKKGLNCLRKPLREWINLNRSFGRRWIGYSGDCPWWYNERALLSVFVGAVWRTGDEAFEEFSEYKRSKSTHSAGRIDLWFSAGSCEFWAEAKACEIAITRSAKQDKRIRAAMAAAKADVCRLAPDGYTGRLAVTFVAPYLTRGHEDIFPERIDWLINLARNTKPDAMAWIFPGFKVLPKHKRWVSPGILILIKQVKRGRPS
jgi:hypothetical protein